MTRRDTLLALLVAVCWGLNFLAIHASLGHYPPMFLVALRFAILALPAILFVPRPQVKLRWLLLYGLGFGILQFVFLYWGMSAGAPTGLSSLLLQASAPLTVLAGAVFLKERISPVQAVGVAVAVAGLGIIAIHRGHSAALGPVLLVLLGAAGWALGNIASRAAQADDPFRFMMWMTVVPPLPMLALSVWVEGPQRIGNALRTAGTSAAMPANLGLLYTVLIATIVGSGIWTDLLRRHASGSVAPFSMLVPVVGFATAWLALGEVPSLTELAGGVLVVAGVLAAPLSAAVSRRSTSMSKA